MTALLHVVPLFFYHIAAIILIISISAFFKHSSIKRKLTLLYTLSFISFVALVFNDICFYLDGWSWLTLLPFHLCFIGVLLIPLSLRLNKPFLVDFIFYLCVPGAFAALVAPSSDYIREPTSLLTASFYTFHFLNVFIPVFARKWGIYDIKPTVKKAVQVTFLALGFTALMHALNLFLIQFAHIQSNYFFTIIEFSAPTNPVYTLMAKLIPYDYFYLWSGLLVIYVYMFLIYLTKKVSI